MKKVKKPRFNSIRRKELVETMRNKLVEIYNKDMEKYPEKAAKTILTYEHNKRINILTGLYFSFNEYFRSVCKTLYITPKYYLLYKKDEMLLKLQKHYLWII